METALATLPYVELVLRAERAISNGASPAFTMKTFCDAGIHEDIAMKAVTEAVQKVENSRQIAIENDAVVERSVSKFAISCCSIGMLLISINSFVAAPWLPIVGMAFIALGATLLVKWHLHK